ncbi:hypothetical protein LZ554_005383 [Drepanopeziza brunnea f. sp. 'monogermtubi']|nr:hypothetical protein LZ554_005383 [Drepanopeziza brunnea f. sp. 'monogermtubi']
MLPLIQPHSSLPLPNQHLNLKLKLHNPQTPARGPDPASPHALGPVPARPRDEPPDVRDGQARLLADLAHHAVQDRGVGGVDAAAGDFPEVRPGVAGCALEQEEEELRRAGWGRQVGWGWGWGWGPGEDEGAGGDGFRGGRAAGAWR